MAEDFKGQTELFITDADEGDVVLREPYSGRLVVTAHATSMLQDPDELTRQLDRWMRDNHLSRVEAYWNVVPPEEP